jgi:hypothetical protein
MFRALAPGVLALILAGSGCGPGEVAVSGTVTLDGAPLAEGHIAFRPLPALATSEASVGPIKDGKYQLTARPGQNRVEIIATRVVPGQKDSFGNPLRVSIIPAKYNVQSELTRELQATGGSELNFDLTSR